MSDDVELFLRREGLVLASIQKRAIAFIIDEFLLSMILMAILWNQFEGISTIEQMIALTNQFILEFIAIKILYQTFFTMQYGASLGKIAVKIRIVEIAGATNPGFGASLNRAVFRVVSEMIFYLGFLWGIMDPNRQCWHDKTAKTLVVNA